MSVGALIERLGYALLAAGRGVLDFVGRVQTKRIRRQSLIPLDGDKILPTEFDGGVPVFEHSDYQKLRVDLLSDFVRSNRITTTIVVGCAYGRELVPFAAANPSQNIIGADLSEKAIEACKNYKLAQARFSLLNIEDETAVRSLLRTIPKTERVAVYLCETAPYILPERLQAFLRILRDHGVVGVQFLEPLFIDWGPHSSGLVFTFRAGFWRHNYALMLERAGYKIRKTDLISGLVRSTLPHQPLWLVNAAID